MNRREFLTGVSAFALGSTTLAQLIPRPAFAAMPGMYDYNDFSNEMVLPEPRPLAEVTEMTPLEMSQSSGLIRRAYDELKNVASGLESAEYRAIMGDILTQPKQTWLSDLYPTDADRTRIFDEMVGYGYFHPDDNADYVFPPGHDNIQTMFTSPQSHNDWYGAHPGGMALVVAFNIRIANAHTENYRQVYGIPTNWDIPACALGVHEYPKSWYHSWNEDGTYGEEPRSLFGITIHTHAAYVVAELMHRGMDAALTMAVAAAHATGTVELTNVERHDYITLTGPGVVADILHAGSVLAQQDPFDYGLLTRTADGGHEMAVLPAEQWITHLGDMNWPYTLGAAHPVSHELLRVMAHDDYGIPVSQLEAFPFTKPFNKLKAYVWAQVGEIALYEVIQREGPDAARALVKRLVTA